MMQVRAHQVFSTHGPQPYALAVLGNFSGTLASSGNPAASSDAAADVCPIVVTTITDGPSGLTNKTCARILHLSCCIASWKLDEPAECRREAHARVSASCMHCSQGVKRA
jgi:hypothetical protein